MPVYAAVNPNLPIQNGGAVGWAPTDKSTQGFVIQGTVETLSTTSGYEQELNGRYKTGGSTGWERPGSNLA